ncbi:GPI ethanolamine phosphate transferase 2 isoform X2 [Aristolochia californica]|uniref:GPI ethanolamine phosphate transferase 2 isoform X2 n=1 Tax=Aristolochia californica TaxID=171875 RepID=UPI0035DCFA97
MATLTCSKLAIFTLSAVLLQVVGLSLFVLGFFPVKPALSGVSGPESYSFPTCSSTDGHAEEMQRPPPEQLGSLYEELSGIPSSFDRLIFMVVDGLPAEFVLGKSHKHPGESMKDAMPYTQSLLSNGKAIGYHAKAAPPTVTMPRLKAMVSGAIGGFLDVAFNFNTQKFLDDNLLGQFDSVGWKMVMHGDETWLKLFPGLFARHDGVSSFFVKDTVEVDHNVTRHLDTELVAKDWNLLILHYLGLDHVGHIGGRHSVLMAPKLKEMDEIIRIIHTTAILLESTDKHTLLVVVSDHGMTDSGNHGGSSYEETDSLVLFVGLHSKHQDYTSATLNSASQVDIAPTLAILFGVPIPKNSVGILIPETLSCLTEEQQLRAIELNSWQLKRLLQAELPYLFCGKSPSKDFDYKQALMTTGCNHTDEEKLHCLFLKALASHDSWKHGQLATSMSIYITDLHNVITEYYKFSRTAAEWLSRRVTDKPFDLLAVGILIMFMSSVILVGLLFLFSSEVSLGEIQSPELRNFDSKWHLDEIFVLAAVSIYVLSLASSSMVEEEQYIWHFLTSTLFFIFLRTSFRGQLVAASSNSCDGHRLFRIFPILSLLICGRILRGWYQGGVNWTHLPDISKWFEQMGSVTLQYLQVASVVLITGLGLYTLHQIKSMKGLNIIVQASILVTSILVLLHTMEYKDSMTGASTYSATSMAQTIFATLGVTFLGVTLTVPWLMPISLYQVQKAMQHQFTSSDNEMHYKYLLSSIRDLSYLIGRTSVVLWCLLQLLLHHKIKAGPILLLFLQILLCTKYFSIVGSHHKPWVEVAAMYFLGMAGHFGLGNSNSLATIDVAGAFIGLSSHSTVLSGILLFFITYASPLLFILSLLMYTPVKEMKFPLGLKSLSLYLQIKVGMPCLVPLALNSVALATFTFILLLMRNHLFVWSVFSPKYLYVCAATLSVYIGVIVVAAISTYTWLVFVFRTKVFVQSPVRQKYVSEGYIIQEKRKKRKKNWS